jgi:ornithine carbamoyltransferase
MGFRLCLACPSGYEPDGDILAGAGENVRLTRNPQEAVQGVDVINTDVWASMGQEKEQQKRIADFRGFQVDENLVKQAKPDAIVLHCLPAHRGEEIAEAVLEGPGSVVFDQAENKMHLHQALLEWLIEERG